MAYLDKDQIARSGLFDKLNRHAKLQIADKTKGLLATGKARALIGELDFLAYNSQSEIEREARSLVRVNTLAVGSDTTIRASPFHTGTFLRDLFFVCQYADSPLLNTHTLETFAEMQDQETGYIPTSRFAFSKTGFTFPDESPYYYPTLLYQTQKEKPTAVITDKMVKAAELATQFISSQLDSSGFCHNKGQTRTYWADELILPDGDTVAFKLGLANIALRAAYELGILPNLDLADKSEEAFRALAKMYEGRLPLSADTGWIDVSALYPVYLSKL